VPDYGLMVRMLEYYGMFLSIEVANLMANRIIYMDRRKIEWRKFNEINFVNLFYEPFDASGWEPMQSGLLGPVTITPIY
jgi:hypothetical protein